MNKPSDQNSQLCVWLEVYNPALTHPNPNPYPTISSIAINFSAVNALKIHPELIELSITTLDAQALRVS